MTGGHSGSYIAQELLGCPAHQSVKDAIKVTCSATLKAGDQVLSLREEGSERLPPSSVRVNLAIKELAMVDRTLPPT
jgi:hypothetical protein